LIEITSFVRPDRVPQMADAEDVVAQFAPKNGVQYTALYLNEKGFERSEATGKLNNEGWIYTAASESFLRHNNNCGIEDTVIAVPKWLDLFKRFGKNLRGVMISTAFGCNYEGKIEAQKALNVLKQINMACNSAGVSIPEISLADTVGRGNPDSVKRLIALVKSEFPKSEISLHLHDTRGTGMTNAYAGLEEGITIFEASVAGLGGCPFAKGAAGNICTEDFAYLCSELGIETGVSLERYVEAARYAAEIVGQPLPGKYYKVLTP